MKKVMMVAALALAVTSSALAATGTASSAKSRDDGARARKHHAVKVVKHARRAHRGEAEHARRHDDSISRAGSTGSARHFEPGDDRGDAAEPGDDKGGGTRPSRATTGAGRGAGRRQRRQRRVGARARGPRRRRRLGPPLARFPHEVAKGPARGLSPFRREA